MCEVSLKAQEACLVGCVGGCKDQWHRIPVASSQLRVVPACCCACPAAGTSSMSGVVYITDEAHKALLDETYSMFSWTNPLHADVFPSVSHKTCRVGTHSCIGKCSPGTMHFAFCQQETLCAGVRTACRQCAAVLRFG